MDKNYDDQVTLDEFIKVFIEAEMVLQDKLKKASKNIQDFKEQQQRIIEDRQDAVRKENVNEFGISQNQNCELTCVVLKSDGHAQFGDDPG